MSNIDSEVGISLRDYFAARAAASAEVCNQASTKTVRELAELFGNNRPKSRAEIIAALSYEIADALLAERIRKNPTP